MHVVSNKTQNPAVNKLKRQGFVSKVTQLWEYEFTNFNLNPLLINLLYKILPISNEIRSKKGFKLKNQAHYFQAIRKITSYLNSQWGRYLL